MKKVLSMVLVLIMVVSAFVFTTSASFGGVDKLPTKNWYTRANKTITVESAEQLIYILRKVSDGETFSGKTIQLTADITINEGDMSKWETKAPAYNLAELAPNSNTFEGVFDGNGHTISGIYSSRKHANGSVPFEEKPNVFNYGDVGLFSRLGGNAIIKNLRITNSFLTASYNVGAIVGRVKDGADITIENVQVDNSKVISIFAQVQDPSLGDVLDTPGIYEKHSCSGGIVGMCAGDSAKVTFKNVLYQGTVAGGGRFVGGICGNMQKCHLVLQNVGFIGTYESYYSTYYQGVNLYKENSGGLIGRCSDKHDEEKGTIISNCFFIGNFKANSKSTTSGLVAGRDDLCTVTDFYANSDAYSRFLGTTDCKDTNGGKKSYFKDKSVLTGDKSVATIGLDSSVWFANVGMGPMLTAFRAQAEAEVTTAPNTVYKGTTVKDNSNNSSNSNSNSNQKSNNNNTANTTKKTSTSSTTKRTRTATNTGDITSYMIAAVAISAAAAVVISKSRKA